MTEHLYSPFEQSLAAGKLSENVLFHEFEFQGVPLIRPPEGKQPFDAYLPSGQSIEMKFDARSQATGWACIEWPTLQRGADIYIHTLCYARVFTSDQYNALYMRGKIVEDTGQYGYHARLIPVRELNQVGTPLYQFIKAVKMTQ